MTAAARSIWNHALDAATLIATPLVPSHYLELVSPLRTTHVRHARVEAVIREADDASTLVLRPGRGWKSHRAGQFVKIGVEVDGRILTRTYSITSSEDRDDGRFTVAVKAIPNGRVSNAVALLRAGSYVRVGLPQGEFVLPEIVPAKILFVTGGSGITPVMSMLRTMRDRAMPDVVHVHYARSREHVIFGRELQRLPFERAGYELAVVETDNGGPSFDAGTLREHAPDFASRETWACGPETLLDAVSEHVGPNLHIERFRAKLAPISTDGTARVRFGRSKREVDAMSASPLLEVAERAGVDAPHGCRIGICHSCDATLVSGCVRDLRTGKTFDEPGSRFQPCVCAAVGQADIDL